MIEVDIMKIIILIICLLVLYNANLGCGEFEYQGNCDGCLWRLGEDLYTDRDKIHEVQKYKLCGRCYKKYQDNEELNLHPSRYCGVWCIHAPNDQWADKCPFKNKPTKIKGE